MFLFLAGTLFAVYVQNDPFEITQPDGSKFSAFVTGDEYYHRVHDAAGYTLLLQPNTGYAVYAIPDGKSIKASAYRAGSINPASLGIAPNLMKHDPDAKAKYEEIQRQRTSTRTPTSGTMNSLVAFIRFAEPSQDEFPAYPSFSNYDNLFNSMELPSLKDYYDEVSAGQLNLMSHLYPAPNASGNVISLVNPHPRGYFSPYLAGVNEIGYATEHQRSGRELELVFWATDLIDALVPPELDVDADDDYMVDGVTLIVRGGVDEWGDILWPTSWSGGIYGSINNKTVNRIIVNIESEMSLNTVCHEMGHQLGAPDFYHYSDSAMAFPPWSTIDPTSSWEMMSNNVGHWLTHTKFKYGHWFTEIPTISPTATPTTYTLTAIDSSPYSCYKIQSSIPNQYYMLEYRRQAGNYESGIPGTGLIVYRVTSGLHGNAGGPPDEVYVYRPGGDLTRNGNPDLAFLSEQSGRTRITNDSDQTPWLWVNTSSSAQGNISITNVGVSGGETITFQVSTGTTTSEYTHTWTGAESTNWHDPANWSPSSVPDQTSVVYIPIFDTHVAKISESAAFCRKLTVGYGGILWIGSHSLFVYENMDVYGSVEMISEASMLAVSQNIHWYSGSSLGVDFSGANIYCKRGFTIDTGADVQMLVGTLIFASGMANPAEDYEAYIVNHNANTILGNIVSDKEGIYSLQIAAESTQPFVINGDLKCNQNRRIRSYFDGAVTLKGDLISENTNAAGIYWIAGTLYLNGEDNVISIPHASGYLNNLIVGGEGEITFPYHLRVKGDLTLQLGADITFGTNTLTVDGNASISGMLTMKHAGGNLTVKGSVLWLSSSRVNAIEPDAGISCQGSMTFESGSIVQINYGYIEFYGNGDSNLINRSNATSLYDLRSNKNASYALNIPVESLLGIDVNGDILNGQNSKFNNYSNTQITLKGDLSNLNATTDAIKWYDGNLLMNGNNQSISLLNPTDFLNSLTVLNSGMLDLLSDLNVRGSFALADGTFMAHDKTITVGGNWNRGNSASFSYGTSTVVFNGTGDQTVNSTIFNTIRLNKSSGKLRILTGSTVTARSYKYNQGTIEVAGGLFTVNDLEDQTIKGNYIISSGAINLSQDNDHFVDIDANLTITGGKIRIMGGYDFPADWAHAQDVTIIMSAGELDFDSRDIDITNTGHALNLQITGGKIRTKGSFTISRTGLSLPGGTVELYGTEDATLSSPDGGSFNNVWISKTTNKVTVDQNLTVANDVSVLSGTLALNAVSVNVGRDLNVNSVIQMNNTGAVLTIGRDFIFGGSSTAVIPQGTINITRDLSQAANTPLQSSASCTINFVGAGDSNLTLKNPSASLGNLGINKSSGTVGISTTAAALNLLGNMNVSVGNQFMFRTIPTVIAGALNVNGSILLSAGGSVTCYDLNMYGDITVAGNLSVQHNYFQAAGTQLIIGSSGNFIIDKPYTGNYQSFAGTTILNGGSITVTNEGIQFGASSSLTINSGTLKTGWSLRALVPASLNISTGSIEFIGNRAASIQLADGNYLHNLVISKTGTNPVMLSSNLTINDLTINSGTFQLLHRTLNISGNMNIISGTLDGAFADDLINLNGWWNNNRSPNGFTQGLGTVALIGSQRSVIYQSEQFNSLIVNKTELYPNGVEVETNASLSANSITFVDGTIYLKGGSTFISPASGFTIPAGCALYCDPDTPSTLNLNGDFWDNNMTVDANGGFSSGKSEINVSGSGDRQFSTFCSPFIMNSLNVNLNSGTFYLNNSHTKFYGNLNLQRGTLQTFMGAIVDCYQDLSSAAGTNIQLSFGNLNIRGNADSSLGILGTAGFNNLSINKDLTTASIVLADNWTAPSMCSLNVSGGILKLNAKILGLSGNVQINQGGTILVDAGSALRLSSGLSLDVNNGGKLAVLGTSATPSLVTRMDSGYYNLNINNGGGIAAEYGIFEYLDFYGVNLQSGAIVDAVSSFNNCTFRNGTYSGTLLSINNEQNLVINNAVFPENTWSGMSNASKNVNYGSVRFLGESGAFAGAGYESDPFTRINWNDQTASIAVSESSLSFGSVYMPMSEYRSFTITNGGSGTLAGTLLLPDDFTASISRTEIRASGSKVDEPQRNSSLDFVVTPGSSIQVQVAFVPTQPISYNATLVITHNAGGAPVNISLSGYGMGAQITVNPTQIIKGILPEGYHTKPLSITDSGNTTLSYFATIEYPSRSRDVIMAESFETGFPPTEWSTNPVQVVGTAGVWSRSTGTVHPNGYLPQDGTYLAYFNSYTCSEGNQTRLRTGALDFSGYSNISLSFWMYHESGFAADNDRIQVQINQIQETWENVGEPIIRYSSLSGWQQHTINLSAYADNSYLFLGFLGISEYGNDIHIDNIVVTGSNPPTGWVSFNGESETISNVLAPGATDQPIVYIYTEGMDNGVYQAEIHIASNDPITPDKVVPIEISVGSPGISVSPAALDFGVLQTGTSSTQNISLEATGSLHLSGTITAPTGYSIQASTRSESEPGLKDSASYRWSGSVAYTLSPGETETYQVRFTPTAIQAYNGNISITSDHLATQTIPLSGSGGNVPVVQTLAATAIASSSATLNANITSSGGLEIWGRGFRYGTAPDPINNGNNFFVAGSNNTYSAIPSGFEGGQQIYFCAFAYNELGWNYGEVLSFTTLNPQLTVTPASAIDFGAVAINTTSAAHSFTVSGSELSGTVGINASEGFRISLTSGRRSERSGSDQITLYPVAGVLAETTIYVFFEPLLVQPYSGTVSIVTTDVPDTDIALSGTGITTPTLTAIEATDITQSTATGGGNITDNGGSAITARGLCYSVLPNPTLADEHTSDGAGSGVFASYLTDLLSGTGYFVCAYATNLAGTAYSESVSFLTLSSPVLSASHTELESFGDIAVGSNSVSKSFIVAGSELSANLIVTAPAGFQITQGERGRQRDYCSEISIAPSLGSVFATILVRFAPPSGGIFSNNIIISSTGAENAAVTVSGIGITEAVLTTKPITDITSGSADSGGIISSDGGSGVTVCGICWSLNPEPTTADNTTQKLPAVWDYDLVMNNLLPSTTYYVRAFATNAAGTAYGNELSFSTPMLSLSAPANLSIAILAGTAVLNWDVVPGAASYKIYRSLNPYAADWGAPVATTINHTWTDLASLVGYFYKVSASSDVARDYFK